MAKTTKKPPAVTKKAAKRPPPAARKKTPAAAPKKKTVVRRTASTRKVRPAPIRAATKATSRALGAALLKATSLTVLPPSGWRNNRHGFDEGALSCYSCSWYQPYINEPLVQTEQVVGASQIGWCRAASVPITNLNMAVLYDNITGSFRTSGYGNPEITNEEVLTEVIVFDATEFWCRIWARTLNAFAWPPNYVTPPPVPNGGP